MLTDSTDLLQDVVLLDDRNNSSSPLITALLRSCEQSLMERGKQDFLGTKRDSLQTLIDEGEIHRLIRSEVREVMLDGCRTPPATTGSVFALAESENFILTLSLLKAAKGARKHLYSLPNDALIANLSPTPFRGFLHAIPSGCDNEIFDQSMSLAKGPCFDLNQGEVCFWDSSNMVPEYTADQEFVVLKLNSKQTQSLLWCYDKDSLRPLMSAACTPLPSRLQMSAMCLSELQDEFDDRQREQSIANLERLAAHDFHYVRWTALQNLYLIASDRAVPLLLNSRESDLHPHVRRAAEKSLRAIGWPIGSGSFNH